MTRQSDKNLLVTVAAFVTTAILVVVFQSYTSTGSSIRLPRQAPEDPLVAALEETFEIADDLLIMFDAFALSPEQSDAFQGELFEEEAAIGERAYASDADVRAGGRGRGKGKKKKPNAGGASFNPKKIKADSIAGLASQMLAAHHQREGGLETFNDIAGATFAHGDPSFAGDDSDESHDFPGYARTAPGVQRFLDEFACSSGSFWSDSSDDVNMYFMIPTTIPLFGDDPVGDYAGYLDFIGNVAGGSFPTGAENRNFRYTIGQYSNWVKFNPGKKYKGVADLKNAQAKFKRPLLSASQPTFFKSLKNAAAQVDRKASTAAVGNNCVLTWFFHDVPRDLDEFMNPDSVDALNDLHAACTIIPIFVAPSTTSNRDMWMRLAAQIVPGRQLQYGRDADYTGIFFAESFEELSTSSDLSNTYNNYLCMLKNRCLCRINQDGYVYPPSEVAPTTGDGFSTEAIEADFREVDDYDDATTTAGTTATEGTTAPATEGTIPATPKTPEIDSCCGHQQFGGVPYDSELKTCCDDAVPRSYMDDGGDPCF